MLLVEERCTVQWAVTVVASAAGAGAADVAVAGPHWSTPEHRPNCPHPTNRIPLPLNRPRRGHRHHSVDPGSGTAAVDRDCVDCRRSADHRRNCVGRRCRRTTDHLKRIVQNDGERERESEVLCRRSASTHTQPKHRTRNRTSSAVVMVIGRVTVLIGSLSDRPRGSDPRI